MRRCLPALLIAGLTATLLLAPARSGPPAAVVDLAPFYRPPAEFANDLGEYRSPLRFADGSVAKSPDDWKKRRREIRAAWDRHLGPWPDMVTKPKVEFLAKEMRGSVTQWHVRVQIAPDRFTEDAYLLVPEGKGPFPATVVVYYEAKTGVGQSKAELRDYAWQLANRGFVALSIGNDPNAFYPSKEKAQLQPLSYNAYIAAVCWHVLSNLTYVDAARIGIVGHSYGGKWAMFASCLFEGFAFAAWSDGGVVFDERRSNVNYWEPWYLGHELGKFRTRGLPTEKNPRTGPYRELVAAGHDLHELHALMAPRPFLVSGGSEDFPARWKALNHAVAVNRLLGYEDRVAMTNRPGHTPTPEANAALYAFFEHWSDRILLGQRAKGVATIVGHRGSSADRPENTLASYRRAIEAGATLVECDLRTTKDGVLVSSHDADLFRTTKTKGLVGQMTLAEIRKLDAGAWFDAKYAGERVPTFREILELCKGLVDVLLDLKETGEEYDERVATEVRKHGDPKRTVIGVRSPEQARRFRKLLPESHQIGLISTPESLEAFAEAKVETVRLWPKWLADERLVARVRQAGLKLHLNGTLGEPGETRELLRHAPESLSSDAPGRLVATLRAFAETKSPR